MLRLSRLSKPLTSGTVPSTARHFHSSNRLGQVMTHLNGFAPKREHTLQSLPKSNVFTSHLPPDAAFPTPKDSHDAPRQTLGPRMVKEALYTYVRPDPQGESELLGVSERALRDLGLREEEAQTEEFKQLVS